MKTLIALLALSLLPQTEASAEAELESFRAEVTAMSCDEQRAIGKLSGTCLVTLTSPKEGELIGLVIHSDLYWDGGKFIRVGDQVRVDLSYTVEDTNELKAYFAGNVARVFFHDNITSQGSYADVISRERRD